METEIKEMSSNNDIGGENLRWRLKKKKGLLKDPEYERLKKRLFRELEEEARLLERQMDRPEHKTG